MDNPPMKITNYGQKEYIIYYDYEIELQILNEEGEIQKIITKAMDRTAKQTLTPYLINRNNHKETIKIITQYYDEFKRFVKKEEQIIEKKWETITIKYYKISQAFLSYLKQSKETLEPLMMEKEYEEIIKYVKDDKEQRKDQIYGGIIHIGGYRKIHDLKIKEINNYEILVKKLEKYFEHINQENEDNWNKYINTQVKKMTTLLNNENALEKMQEEYRKIYEEKIKN